MIMFVELYPCLCPWTRLSVRVFGHGSVREHVCVHRQVSVFASCVHVRIRVRGHGSIRERFRVRGHVSVFLASLGICP